MAFISKEIPSGAIDGVNKVFTLVNPIQQLDDVWYDGAITPNVTVTGTSQITLTYAPTTSIYVDYYDAPVVNPSTGFLLVSDLRDILERYEDDDLPDVSDDVFLDFVNDLQLSIHEEVFGINTMDYLQNQDFTYSSDIVALESDFENVKGLYCGLYELDDDGNEKTQYPQVGIKSDIKGFNIQGTNLHLIGNFSGNLRLKYLPISNDLTTTADSTIIPDNRKFYPAIRTMLAMLYEGRARGDDNQEVIESVKYKQSISKLKKWLGKQVETIDLYNV